MAQDMADTDFFFGLEGPLDALPGDGQMRAANLKGLHDLALQNGSDPARILERYGLEPRTIADPDSHISCQTLVDVFEYCSNLFDDPLFGLHIADLQDPDVYGCVAALCRAAANVREAIGCFIDYLPVTHSPALALELCESRTTAELRWTVNADLGVNDQATFQGLLLNIKLLRSITAPGFAPTYVTLCTDIRDRDIPEIERVTACRVIGGAQTNAIGIPIQALDQPIASANRLIFRLLGGYLERVKNANRVTVVERAEGYIRGALPTGTCSIERCAQKLGMSVRTLQGRLAQQGIKFSEIVDAQRERLARIYLLKAGMPLEEVAERLGYGEQTSFGRAFKRWTGMTPQKFRAAH
jgi:AraC-like DNA-binding protein